MAIPEVAHIIIPGVCSRCKEKQVVHVSARTGGAQYELQTIPCIRYGKHFDAKMPDRIIDGPFPM